MLPRSTQCSLINEGGSQKRAHKISLAGRIKVNPEIFCQYIKSNGITRERVGPIGNNIRSLCVDLQGIRKILNEYLSSVFTKETDLWPVKGNLNFLCKSP